MQALKYISEIHKSECPFTIASYSVRLLILGSLQTQRAVTSTSPLSQYSMGRAVSKKVA